MPGLFSLRTVLTALLMMVHGPAVAAGNAAAGETKARACVVCHGPSGLSERPDAPNLAGQIAFYVAQQLRDYRSGKRVHPVMSIVASGLSGADIDDLAAWYASIKITIELQSNQ